MPPCEQPDLLTCALVLAQTVPETVLLDAAAAIERQGWLRRKVKSFKLEHLWGKLKSSGYPLVTPHEPSKTRLAQEKLWPMLEKRIALALQEGDEEAIPVFKMVREAWRLAATTRRRQVAMFPPRRGEV